MLYAPTGFAGAVGTPYHILNMSSCPGLPSDMCRGVDVS
jgi:hypothetical protein